MRTPLTSSHRPGALSAGGVFAITMAMVAGLIVACAVKILILDKKPTAPEAPPATRQLTVAATNIYDKIEITANMIKTITVPQSEYDKYVEKGKKRGGLLTGKQPVLRLTREPIRADEPIFEDQLQPFSFPETLTQRVRPGMQAAVISVPAHSTMAQIGEKVDLLATLSNTGDVFGRRAGANATAMLADRAEVVARFGTLRTGVPPPPGADRTYTLEVEPWQAAIIELAKRAGATFALSVSNQGTQGTGDVSPAAGGIDTAQRERYNLVRASYRRNNTVSEYDLATLFGVREPDPVPRFYQERWAGNTPLAPNVYAIGGGTNGTPGPTGPNESRGPNGTPEPIASTPPPLRLLKRPDVGPAMADESQRNNVYAGFQAPTGGSNKYCPTCGQKQ